MEDLMIIGGFGLFFLAAVFFIVHKLNKIRIERERVILEERKRQIEETRKWREKMYERMKTESPSKSSVPPRGKEMTKTYTPTYAPSPTQSVQSSNNDGIDMLTSMMIFDAISNHHQQPSRSPGDEIVAQSTSPSFTDSGPSYKDDSPSSSWSSSSSDSSSSWSSSDSSPSSDW